MDATFIAEFPVWTILRGDKVKPLGLLAAIPRMGDGDGNLFPIFTDKDLAESFIERSGMQGVNPFAFTSPILLRTVLESLKKVGCNRVGFDLSIFNGATQGRTYPVEEVIHSLPAAD